MTGLVTRMTLLRLLNMLVVCVGGERSSCPPGYDPREGALNDIQEAVELRRQLTD